MYFIELRYTNGKTVRLPEPYISWSEANRAVLNKYATRQVLYQNNEREFKMLKNFENWLLKNNYSASTSADYMGRIERLCRKEQFTLSHLVENLSSILPQYETTGEKSSYGKRSHTSVRQALRRFKMFLASEKLA